MHLLHEQSQYISNIEMELGHARTAVQELKIIQRAKLILIEQHKLTEQQAHHQLQKLAMDRQEPLADIATQVVQMMSNAKKKSANLN
jgi:AmiR/NasT family two-component response regulator